MELCTANLDGLEELGNGFAIRLGVESSTCRRILVRCKVRGVGRGCVEVRVILSHGDEDVSEICGME